MYLNVFDIMLLHFWVFIVKTSAQQSDITAYTEET